MLATEEQEKLITTLLKKSSNLYCADCSTKSPCCTNNFKSGASLDFGVFICMNCAGAHRGLGQSVTRVKSTKLDAWNREWLWLMQLGNQTINQHFEHSLTIAQGIKIFSKPNMNSSLPEITKYIKDKYRKKLYANQEEDDPITRLKNGTYSPKKQVKKEKAEEPKKVEHPAKPVNKKKVEVDLLGQTNEAPKPNLDLIEDTKISPKTFDKNQFNSFSGMGAKSNHIDFESVWKEEKQKESTPTNFTTFDQLAMNQKKPQTQHNPYLHQHPQYQSPPQHVTMNINMNMYPNVMNINVNGTNSPPPPTNPLNQVQFSQPITLETKAHDLEGKKEKEKKSWVDDWK